ncbi:MAG: AsmA-like C-terminal domain-containing protein, partial [Pseudomonadota bacterium]
RHAPFQRGVWAQENLTAGQVTNLRYKSDIPMGAIRESVALPDETMRFTFDAADATVRYLSDMPPIRQLRASATVTGNSFEVVAQSGQISDVRLSRGRLSMPQFKPAGADALFEARLIGQVPAVLRALGEASLLTFEEDSYQPEAFQGFGQFDLSVKWPLINDPAIEDVVITGEGSFAEGGIDNVLPGIDASRAKGRVILNRDRVIVRGTGTAASAPGTFEWRQALGDQRTADLSVSAEIDPFAADMIGLPLREFFDGVFTTQIYAKDLTPGAPLKITGELASAAIDIPALGLRKDTGVDAFFEATAVFPDEDSADPLAGLVGLSDLKLQSGGFNIEGDGVFTQEGGIVRLALPRFSIQDKADIALQLVNDSGNLDIDIKGAFAAAAPLLDEMFTSAGVGGRLPGRASLNIAIDEVALRSGVSLGEVKASGRHNGAGFDNLEVAAQLGRSDKLSITLDRPLTENVGFLEIESTDFGSLARGVFGVRSISGAAGSLKGATVDDEGFSGRFETGQLIIKDAPTLARILAIGSLDALADLLGGEGIRFDKLEGDVWLREGRIGLSDAKLVGSSLGISAAGTIDLVDGMIDMRGAIAPAYAINSVLGLLPGIGRLLVSRDGEGILAFAYQVEGPLDKPTVTVNTLTALTPGILRRIFEPVEGSAEETSKVIDAAIAEARRKAETSGQQNGGEDQPPSQPTEPQP